MIHNELVTPKDPSQGELESVVALYRQGQLEKALSLATQTLKRFPHSAVIYNILAAVNSGLGNFDAAIDNFKRAIKINPSYAEAYNNMGNTLKEQGDLKAAIDSYEQALKIKPDYALAYNNMGNVFYKQGDLGAAINHYRQALKINPSYIEAYTNMGLAQQEKGDLVAALDSHNQALEIKPDYAYACYNAGNTLKEQGDIAGALDSYRRALKINPDYALAHNNMGNALQEKGDLGAAIDSYRHALKIEPNYVEAYTNMGIVQQKQGDLVAAIGNYQKALKIKPNYAQGHSNMGNALKEKGDLEGAMGSYQQALNIKPDYALAYNNMGNALKDTGALGAALDNYKKALKIRPDFADAYYNMGILLYEARQYKEAARQFELSGLKISAPFLLTCIYEQNDRSKFYEQLDYLIGIGEINSTIGSLASRSVIKYKTKRTNPFCNDPLKYIFTSNLTEQYNFKNIFVDAAKNILEGNLVSNKKQGHLTNGIQTAGNLFSLENSLIGKIRTIIQLELEKYRDLFSDSEEGLIKHWPTSYSIEGWLVSMKSGGKLAAHMHDSGWITGSIYINIPPKVKKNSGNLVLCIEDPLHMTGENIDLSKEISVDTGSLCIFPSSLLHYTIPFESTEERVVLAFDMIPK